MKQKIQKFMAYWISLTDRAVIHGPQEFDAIFEEQAFPNPPVIRCYFNDGRNLVKVDNGLIYGDRDQVHKACSELNTMLGNTTRLAGLIPDLTAELDSFSAPDGKPGPRSRALT